MYYYLDENQLQHGPIAKENLVSYGVKAENYVWKAGMPEWQKAKDVPELQQYFNIPPASPSQQQGYANAGAAMGSVAGVAGYGAANSRAYEQTAYAQPQPSYPRQQGMYGQQHRQAPQKPESYLVWSILATLCCCLPAGIVGIVYSAQVDSHYNNGRYQQAIDASSKAKTWCIVSLVLGLIANGIFFIAALADM